MHVEELLSKIIIFFSRVDSFAVFDAMNGKCAEEKCSLCTCKFQGRRHQHLKHWCPTVHSVIDQDTASKVREYRSMLWRLLVNIVGVHDSSWEDG